MGGTECTADKDHSVRRDINVRMAVLSHTHVILAEVREDHLVRWVRRRRSAECLG